ncbi:unnamed protein product [Parnassius apollo]|uniref:(apollo) hypothetical protein n=1 Tax=Parnassius apollo TaxID=110799 RepID=A0A8S3WLF7_PARAO|nr:unnamed protein product [Parnassius apollo]
MSLSKSDYLFFKQSCNHMSLARTCPAYQREKRLRELMAEFNCTYRKALTIIVTPSSPVQETNTSNSKITVLRSEAPQVQSTSYNQGREHDQVTFAQVIKTEAIAHSESEPKHNLRIKKTPRLGARRAVSPEHHANSVDTSTMVHLEAKTPPKKEVNFSELLNRLKEIIFLRNASIQDKIKEDKEEKRQKWRDERKNLKKAQYDKARCDLNEGKNVEKEKMHAESKLRKENHELKREIITLRKRFEALRKKHYRKSKKVDELNKAFQEIKEKYQQITTKLKEHDCTKNERVKVMGNDNVTPTKQADNFIKENLTHIDASKKTDSKKEATGTQCFDKISEGRIQKICWNGKEHFEKKL